MGGGYDPFAEDGDDFMYRDEHEQVCFDCPPEDMEPPCSADAMPPPSESDQMHNECELPLASESGSDQVCVSMPIAAVTSPNKRKRILAKTPCEQSPYGPPTIDHKAEIETAPSSDSDADGPATDDVPWHRVRNVMRNLYFQRAVAGTSAIHGKKGDDRRMLRQVAWGHLEEKDKTAFAVKMRTTNGLTRLQTLAVQKFTQDVETKKRTAKFLHAKTAFLTYHGKLWVYDSRKIDIHSLDVVAAAKALTVDKAVRLHWRKIVQDVTDLIERTHAVTCSYSFELCPKSYAEKILRAHVHLAIEFNSKKSWWDNKIEGLMVAGVRPTHSSDRILQGKGGRRKVELNAQHYYLQMPKAGKIFAGGNHVAYVDFNVKPQWVQNWFQVGKLSAEDAKKEQCKKTLRFFGGCMCNCIVVRVQLIV